MQKAKLVLMQLEEKSTNDRIDEILKEENANIIEGHKTIKKLEEEMVAIQVKIEGIQKSNRKRARTVEILQSIESTKNESLALPDGQASTEEPPKKLKMDPENHQ